MAFGVFGFGFEGFRQEGRIKVLDLLSDNSEGVPLVELRELL